jgi:hypothetical protein
MALLKLFETPVVGSIAMEFLRGGVYNCKNESSSEVFSWSLYDGVRNKTVFDCNLKQSSKNWSPILKLLLLSK